MVSRIGILGASGYTGSELVRLIVPHPQMEIVCLTADRKAGQAMGDVFPQFGHLDLPVLTRMDDADLASLDLVFCALPHGLVHDLAGRLPDTVKIVDLSADFRFANPKDFETWYKEPHGAPALQAAAAYGIPEFHREDISAARLTANSGCHVVTSLLPLVPLVEAGAVETDGIVVDTKSGVSGAGRAAKEAMLHTEVSEGIHAYGLGWHRHMGEFDQALSRAAGELVEATFVPHLVPMNRGLLATIYLKGDPEAAHATLAARYKDEPFVHVLPFGQSPQTRHVRGSNHARIGVSADRSAGRMIVTSVTDNLGKGASGQALQCANLMLGLPETMGLEALPLFP